VKTKRVNFFETQCIQLLSGTVETAIVVAEIGDYNRRKTATIISVDEA